MYLPESSVLTLLIDKVCRTPELEISIRTSLSAETAYGMNYALLSIRIKYFILEIYKIHENHSDYNNYLVSFVPCHLRLRFTCYRTRNLSNETLACFDRWLLKRYYFWRKWDLNLNLARHKISCGLNNRFDYFQMIFSIRINMVTASPNIDEISFTSSSLGSTKVESSISFGNIIDI